MRRLKWLAILLVIATAGVAIGLRMLAHDAAAWHVDPATAERPGRDNDFLIAPEGTTAAPPDVIAQTRPVSPRDLLFQFDAIARNATRTQVVGGSVEDGWITYVQRSALFGFPDYVSVRAVPVGEEAGLIIWSRSRFGYSDMGVNRARVEDWLSRMGG